MLGRWRPRVAASAWGAQTQSEMHFYLCTPCWPIHHEQRSISIFSKQAFSSVLLVLPQAKYIYTHAHIHIWAWLYFCAAKALFFLLLCSSTSRSNDPCIQTTTFFRVKRSYNKVTWGHLCTFWRCVQVQKHSCGTLIEQNAQPWSAPLIAPQVLKTVVHSL